MCEGVHPTAGRSSAGGPGRPGTRHRVGAPPAGAASFFESVLVDTSVWVGHFKQRNEHLVALLETGLVVCHPYVVVEVACGTPPRRSEVLRMLSSLESAPVATSDELLDLVHRQGLYGRGCGFVDLSLLASAMLSGRLLLWSLDKRQGAVAADLGYAYQPRPSS